MSEGCLTSDNIEFASGATTHVKATATPNTLTFVGDASADVLLSGVATPIDSNDAVNKNYVDIKTFKNAVKAASTGNIVLSPGTTPIDGVTISNGDRVLLKNQTTTTENGIYILTGGDYIRTDDAIATFDAGGVFVSVTDGVVNADSLWQCTDPNGTLFNAGITFTEFTGGGGGGSGDVVGPVSSTDNAITRWDGTTGKLVQDSGVLLDDLNAITGLSSIQFDGSTSGSLTIDVPATITSYTMTLPTDDGNASDFLQTDGSGILSWAAGGGGGGTPGGADTQIQFNNTGSFDGSPNFIWDDTNNIFTIVGTEIIGSSTVSGTPNLQGSQLEVESQTYTDNSGGPTTGSAAFNTFAQPTLAATAATTTTNAATVYIEGSPIAGTNETITNSYSLWVDSGKVQFDDDLNVTQNITSDATIQGSTITDGSFSSTAGAITGTTSITSSGAITGDSITDGIAILNGGFLSNLSSPAVGTDAANRNYVDSAISTSASPGGVNTNIQFNNSSTFGGSSDLTWNDTTKVFNIIGSALLSNSNPTGTPSTTGSHFATESQTFTDNSGGPTTTNAVFNSFAQPTLAATAATTTTNAATVYIAGEPLAGTNETLTNEYALWVDSGVVQFDDQLHVDGTISGSGTITGNTITDGTFSSTSGVMSSITSLTATTIIGTTINTTGSISASGNIITGSDNPSNASDLANKAYVDSVASGLSFKDAVRLGTTTVLTLTGEQTIDGVAAITGDRVLVKNGTVANPPAVTTESVDNGIWIVSVGAWARSADLATGSDAHGISIFIEEGTTQESSGWVCNNAEGDDLVGTDDLVFVQFTGAGLIIAGAGLDKTGNTLSANVDEVTTTISSDNIIVKDEGINTTQLADNAVTTLKLLDANVTNAKLLNSSLNVTAGDGLQNGGLVSLGGSVTLNVDSTILRTTGDQSASGVQSFTNTTDSTSVSTGAVVIDGGLGIDKNITGGADATFGGTVEGNTLTDGTMSSTNGVITNVTSIGTGSLTASMTIEGDTITDGTMSSTAGAISGATTITASSAITGGSITDGTATLSAGTLSGLITPSADSDAANKKYVDDLSLGLQFKDPVRVATTINGILASAYENNDTIDGVTLVTGDRILIKNQSTPSENGIYTVNVSGAPTRATDMATSADASNFAVLVEEGSSNSGTSWVVTGVDPYTVGTSDIIWTQFAGGAVLGAGDGLEKVGNTFNVLYDDSTINLLSNELQIKDLGILSTKLASNSITTAKITDANVTNAKLLNSSLTVSAGDGLQNGGLVSLGGSVTINVDSTVLRTMGNQSMSGIQTITNITESSSTGTGSLILAGGLGVAKNITGGGNATFASGTVEGLNITDGTMNSTGGVMTGAVSIATGSLTGSGTVQGATVQDGSGASMTGGDFTGIDATFSNDLTLSNIPSDRILFTDTGGLVTSDALLTWDGTLFSASTLDTQTITRPNDPNTASLWSDGVGNIDIGLLSEGTVQLGKGPTLELTQTSSTLQSELTIQSNLSRVYSLFLDSTAGNITYTAQQFFDGLINRNCNGADRTDTTPTAAQLVAIVPNAVVGSSMEVVLRNTSTGLELLSLTAGTNVTFSDSITVAAGLTSRFLVRFDNVTLLSESVTIYNAVPKDRLLLQASFTNPTSGGNNVAYAQFGPESTADVDSTRLGSSGVIKQLVCSYSSNTDMNIGNTESLAFSIGFSNDDLDVFTVATGGLNLIVWDRPTAHNEFPSTSSSVLNIPFTATDRIAIRSVETGTVNPTTSEVRCILKIELD